MRMGRGQGIRLLAGALAMLALLLATNLVEGHAILKESNPPINGKVVGPDVPVKLRFNVRIDAKLSKLQLLRPDNSISDLSIDAQPAPDTLTAKVTGLKPGSYQIRWQVLAPDGHITRGEIPFTVTGS